MPGAQVLQLSARGGACQRELEQPGEQKDLPTMFLVLSMYSGCWRNFLHQRRSRLAWRRLVGAWKVHLSKLRIPLNVTRLVPAGHLRTSNPSEPKNAHLGLHLEPDLADWPCFLQVPPTRS